MKNYKRETLRNDLEFDIYYTGSLNYAYLYPHSGHILSEDIMLDNKLIPKGYILFYHHFSSNVEIMSPEQWLKHPMSCYKVEKRDHEETIKKWSWNPFSFDNCCPTCGQDLK